MKRLLFTLLVQLRLLPLWRYFNRKRITIIMLHGVVSETTQAGWRPLWERPALEKVGQVLKQLCSHYTPISLDQATRILDGSAPPVEHGLVVTFDDGYRNNFDAALPLLQKMGVPATFFVATGFVETATPYWVDRLDFALQHAPDESRHLRGNGYDFDLRGLDHEGLAQGYRNLRVTLKKNEQSDADMLRIVNEFAEVLEAQSDTSVQDILDDDPFVSVATWAENRAACDAGATIGSHSVDHYRLTAIPEDEVDRQLIESKEEIETRLGRDCQFFCYPNGSENALVRLRTKNANYRAAVTTVHGLNSIGDDLFALKRYPLPQSLDPQEDLLRLSGILESRLMKAVLGKG